MQKKSFQVDSLFVHSYDSFCFRFISTFPDCLMTRFLMSTLLVKSIASSSSCINCLLTTTKPGWLFSLSLSALTHGYDTCL